MIEKTYRASFVEIARLQTRQDVAFSDMTIILDYDTIIWSIRILWKKLPFPNLRPSALPCWSGYGERKNRFASRASVTPLPRSCRLHRPEDRASGSGSMKDTMQILGDIVAPVIDEADIKALHE